MALFKTMLAGLELSDTDYGTVRYAAHLASLSGTEKAYFLHVEKNLDVDEALKAEFPSLAKPIDEQMEAKMRATVAAEFKPEHAVDTACDVVEGQLLDVILGRAKVKHADVIVLGHDEEPNDDEPDLGARITRKAPCTCVVVPKAAPPRISKILVPVDFSDNSGHAFDVAVALSRAAGNAPIVVHHVYFHPTHYYTTGKTFEEFAAIMLGHAKRHFQEFAAKRDLSGINVTEVYTLSEHTSQAILDTAAAENCDLTVIGARGRTNAAAVLLGSVAERLLRTIRVPLIAVKEPGKGMTFLEALLQV